MDAGEPLHDTQAVRAIDREAIARGTPGFELMRRAAEAAFFALRRHWPEARRIVIACGRGNNGGDGFLLGCLLREAGLQVWLCAATPSESTSRDARIAREAWERHGPVGTLAQLRDHVVDLAVDALLGVGLSRAPEGELARAIESLGALDAPLFALDVPSGLDAERGTAPGAAVRATRTITFIADKRGLHTGQGRDCSGIVECAALDVDAASLHVHAPVARLLHERDLARYLRPRRRNAHKGDHGHVLCLGGERGMGGAVRLCAEGALRAGAGWASVATRAEHVAPLLAARPEAMTRAVESDEDLAPMLQRATVLALGPGLGQGDWGRALFAAALRSGKPIVIDADALNLLAVHAERDRDAPYFVPPMADIVGVARPDVPRGVDRGVGSTGSPRTGGEDRGAGSTGSPRTGGEDRGTGSTSSPRTGEEAWGTGSTGSPRTGEEDGGTDSTGSFRTGGEPSNPARGEPVELHSPVPTLAHAILTPHPGEAARLLGCAARDIETDRFAAAERLAHAFGATVILKGAGSIVAAPGRTPCVVGAGNPGMASAGMGDVLTGVVAALRAQGLDPFDAACAGALLHAAAGDLAAQTRGERGLLASDLFDAIHRLANPAAP